MGKKEQREAFLLRQAWGQFGSVCKCLAEADRMDLVKKLHGLGIDFIQLTLDAKKKLSVQEKAEVEDAEIELLGNILRNPFSQPGEFP